MAIGVQDKHLWLVVRELAHVLGQHPDASLATRYVHSIVQDRGRVKVGVGDVQAILVTQRDANELDVGTFLGEVVVHGLSFVDISSGCGQDSHGPGTNVSRFGILFDGDASGRLVLVLDNLVRQRNVDAFGDTAGQVIVNMVDHVNHTAANVERLGLANLKAEPVNHLLLLCLSQRVVIKLCLRVVVKELGALATLLDAADLLRVINVATVLGFDRGGRVAL